MLGKKKCTRKIFYEVNVEDFVDEDDFYRQLNKVFPDLSYLYTDERIKNLYGTTGNPSLDPVIFFRIEFVGYIENEESDRKLAKYIKGYMPARWFIKYDLDEGTPVHSTISRTRQKMPLEIYKEIFEIILKECVKTGLVGGVHQSQDTTLISANASLDSLEKKKPQLTIVERYEKAVEENRDEAGIEEESQEQSKEEVERETELKIIINKEKQKGKSRTKKGLSNKEYRHKYEPEAKIARKKNARTDMYYKGDILVDSNEGIITHAGVEQADVDDREISQKTMEAVKDKLKFLGLEIQSYAGDSNFFSEENIKYFEEKGIEAYIPKQKHKGNRKEFDASKFKYDKARDEYICPGGKRLKYYSTYRYSGKEQKVYKCDKKKCALCPLKTRCTDSKNGRQLYISENKKYIEDLLERLKRPFAKIAARYRKAQTEGAFSQLKNQLGLRKFLVHGLKQVNKKFILGAAVYNLRKLVKQVKNGPHQLNKAENGQILLNKAIKFLFCLIYRMGKIFGLVVNNFNINELMLARE